MSKQFEELLQKAIYIVEKDPVSCRMPGNFTKLYPFTTENINGYIDMFDFKGKTLLTIGSSGDQIINAAFKGCKDITVLDICPFTKFYFYLKNAARISLGYEQFINFFYRRDFHSFSNDLNYNSLNIAKWNDVFPVLKQLDEESFQFWKELYNRFNPIQIRDNLFSHDEYGIKIIKATNSYLIDKESYNNSKNGAENIKPKFITADIFNFELKETYDNIILSNLGAYFLLHEYKSLINELSLNLNKNGKLLLCYLYSRDNAMPSCVYDDGKEDIYNIRAVYETLGEYITSYESFVGVTGLNNDSKSIKDSVLIYEKKK